MALSQAYLEGEQATERRVERRVKVSLVLRLLNARLGEISAGFISEIEQLPTEQLDALAVALLNFSSALDLERWFVASRSQ